MKNPLLTLIVLLIGSAPAQVNDERQEIKKNQSIRLMGNGDVELLVKEYFNEAKQTSVTLISTVHFGDKSFYDKIADLIKGKVVLYELYGMPWETKKLYKESLHRLGESYLEKNRLVQLLTNTNLLIAEAFGLSAEANEKNLDTAGFLIHADTNEQNELITQLANNKTAFEENVDALARQIFERDNGKVLGNLSTDWNDIKKNNPAQNLDGYLQRQNTTLFAALEKILESKVHELKQTGLNKVINDLLMANQSPLAWQDIVRYRRNQQVNPILESLIYSLTAWPNGYNVAILYGVLHFKDTDEILKKYGFLPKENGEQWIKLLNIPSPCP